MNFSALGTNNNRRETFSVNGVMLIYPPDDPSMVTTGFYQIKAKGGPIHDGVFARINFIEDRIVRLEVCETPMP